MKLIKIILLQEDVGPQICCPLANDFSLQQTCVSHSKNVNWKMRIIVVCRASEDVNLHSVLRRLKKKKVVNR